MAAEAALVQQRPTNLSASAPCKQSVQPVGEWLAGFFCTVAGSARRGRECFRPPRSQRPRGEQERCGGPKHRPGLQPLSAVHIPVDLKVILQRGAPTHFCVVSSVVLYPVCDCLQEATCASAVFSFVHSTTFFSYFLDGTARKRKRQLLLW